MRHVWAIVLVTATVALTGGSSAASPYSLSWGTVTANGGASTGGSYMVRSAIGQAQAGEGGRGGSFTLSGGVGAGLVQRPDIHVWLPLLSQ
jgi:hypothetical protein